MEAIKSSVAQEGKVKTHRVFRHGKLQARPGRSFTSPTPGGEIGCTGPAASRGPLRVYKTHFQVDPN